MAKDKDKSAPKLPTTTTNKLEFRGDQSLAPKNKTALPNVIGIIKNSPKGDKSE